MAVLTSVEYGKGDSEEGRKMEERSGGIRNYRRGVVEVLVVKCQGRKCQGRKC